MSDNSMTIKVRSGVYEGQTEWSEFLDANRDGLTVAEAEDMLATIQAGLVYQGGGGAFAEFSVELAESGNDNR